MIVLMAGLPGTGKTTLARELATRTSGRVLSKDEIRHAISGNLCRCTGYMNIVKAVQYAADKMAEGG